MSQTKAQLIDNLVQPITGATGSASAPTFSFTSDPNTGLYSPGADQLALTTNASERIRIGANGEIGLAGANYGTSGQVLTSAGSGAAPTWTTPSAGNTDKIEEGNSSAEVIDTGSDGRFVVTTEGNERLRVDSSGRLGIGTNSPTTLLDCRPSGRTGLRIINTDTATTNQITFQNDSNFYGAVIGTVSGDTTSTGDVFGLGYSTNPVTTDFTPVLSWTANTGRVGIGTTSPYSLLNLYGSTGLTLNLDDPNWQATAIKPINEGGGYRASLAFYTHATAGSAGAATERARIDSSGRLLVGTSSNRATNITGTTNNVVIESAGSWASLVLATNQNAGSAAYQTFLRSRGTTAGSTTIVQNGDGLGYLSFEGTDGSNPIPAAWISAHVDGAPGTNDMPGRLVFSTTADGASSPTERMRISSNGTISTTLSNDTSNGNAALSITRGYGVHPGKTSNYYGVYSSLASSGGNIDNTASIFGESINDYCPGVTGKGGTTVGTGYGVQGWAVGNTDGYGQNYGLYSRLQQSGAGNGFVIGVGIELPNYAGTGSTNSMGIWYRSAYTGANTQTVLLIQRNNTTIGSITTTASATAYNTSSDYRLKENIVPLQGAADRLKSIPVRRFNFIVEPSKTVDGFIAHEVQPFVPEAITGEKDEVKTVPALDANGQPLFDEEGNAITEQQPSYQSIDQSKLVPLLTAALQEALAKIEILEIRLTAAGI